MYTKPMCKETMLFHRDVFFPASIVEDVKQLQTKHFKDYVLSKHLMEHLAYECEIKNSICQDRSHSYAESLLVSCLNQLSIDAKEPFEVELGRDIELFNDNKWHITKYCIRVNYNNTEDVAIVIRPRYYMNTSKIKDYQNLIATAWLNATGDNHYTLDFSKYCNKEDWNNANSI